MRLREIDGPEATALPAFLFLYGRGFAESADFEAKTDCGSEHVMVFYRMYILQGDDVMTKLLHADITEQILGAAFEVHAALGPGFLESIYEEAICYELQVRGMQVQRQARVPIFYKKFAVGTHVLDLIVADKVVVELKAITELVDVHKAIAWSYLAATKLTVALLINFGQPSVKFKRIVRERT